MAKKCLLALLAKILLHAVLAGDEKNMAMFLQTIAKISNVLPHKRNREVSAPVTSIDFQIFLVSSYF